MERQQEQVSRGPPRRKGKVDVKVGRPGSKRPKPQRPRKVSGGLKAQFRKLRAQVERLQVQVEQVQEQLAVRPQMEPRVGAAHVSPVRLELQPDEYERWIVEYLDELAKYPDCFVAIDPERGRQGVVLHSSDEAQFVDGLHELRAKDRDACERLLITHTSTYVSSSAAGRVGQ